MGKILIVLLALFGAYLFLAFYFPSTFHEGFTLLGHPVTWAFVGLITVGYIGYRLKS